MPSSGTALAHPDQSLEDIRTGGLTDLKDGPQGYLMALSVVESAATGPIQHAPSIEARRAIYQDLGMSSADVTSPTGRRRSGFAITAVPTFECAPSGGVRKRRQAR